MTLPETQPPTAGGPAPAQVRRNVLANYLGSGWSAFVSLVFVPMYIKYLGVEAYGLVGFFITIQALLVILDMGLSAIANREMARRSAIGDARGMRDLLRTLELIFWGVAALIAASVAVLAAPIASHWLRSDDLQQSTVAFSVVLMGLAIAAQWPASVYTGALLGLQRHAALNVILAFAATLRAVGALIVLAFVSPTIVAFFAWYIGATLAQTALMSVVAWRKVPVDAHRPRVRWALIAEQRRFAAGVTGAYMLTLVLTQLDKVLLSRLLPLRSFGYYALASVIAMSLYRLVSPVVQGVYPRLTQLATVPEWESDLVILYHRASQTVAVLMLPAAVIVAAFSQELLLLWTRDPVIASETWRTLSALVLGMAVYGLAAVPHALQLAHGWTRLSILTNAAAVAIVVPGVLLGVRIAGGLGAAIAWLVMSVVFLATHIHFTHRRLLRGQAGRWLVSDFAAPLLSAGAVAVLFRLGIPDSLNGVPLLLALLVAGAVAVAAALFAMPEMRAALSTGIRAGRR